MVTHTKAVATLRAGIWAAHARVKLARLAPKLDAGQGCNHTGLGGTCRVVRQGEGMQMSGSFHLQLDNRAGGKRHAGGEPKRPGRGARRPRGGGREFQAPPPGTCKL